MEEMFQISFTDASYTNTSPHQDIDHLSCPSGSEASTPEREFRCELQDQHFQYTSDSDFYSKDSQIFFHCLNALSCDMSDDPDKHTLESVRRKLCFDSYTLAKEEPGLDSYDIFREDSGHGDRSAKRERLGLGDATGRECSKKSRRVDIDKVKTELTDISDSRKWGCAAIIEKTNHDLLYAEVVEQASRYDGGVNPPLPESSPEAVAQSTDHGNWLVTPNGEVMVRLGNGLLYDIDLTDATPVVPPLCDHTATTDVNRYDSNNNVCLPATVCAYQSEDYYCEQSRTAQSFLHGTCMNVQPAKNDHNGYENGRSRRCPPAISGSDQEDLYRCTSSGGRRRQASRTERLWEFILRLLGDPQHNPRLIEWVERPDGTFRLNNSKAIARMWGMRKNNEQMTYEKLSRALRYYYHRKILEPVLGKKLVYRFGPKATQVWAPYTYRSQQSTRHA